MIEVLSCACMGCEKIIKLDIKSQREMVFLLLCASSALNCIIRLMFFIRHFKCQDIGGFSVNLNSITWQALIAN